MAASASAELMPRGVYIEVRHEKDCPASGRESRRCRCSPTARARVAGAWISSQRLARDWKLGDLDALELSALKIKQAHDSGRKIIEKHRVPTVAEWGKDWLGEIEALVAAGDYSPNTIRGYRSMFHKHLEPEVGDLLLTQVTHARVNQLRAKLAKTLKPNTVAAVIGMLSGMLADAMPKHLDTNPAVAPRKRRRRAVDHEPAPERVMALDVVAALLASTEGLLHDMILTGVTTGMRQREIAGLRVSQLDLRTGRVLVNNQLVGADDRLPKYESVRHSVLCPTLVARLQLRSEHTDSYVFLLDGEPLSAWKQAELLNDAWDTIATRPKGQSWHVLRHTFATTLRRNGVSQFVIDALMGHGKRGVPALYQHVLDEEMDAATEVVEMAFCSTPGLQSEAGVAKENGAGVAADPAAT